MTAVKAPTVSDVVSLAQQVLSNIKSQMLDADTATAQRAFSDSNEALGSLERSVTLAQYELVRQHETKKAREAAAAEKATADKARAEADERRKHMVTLEREAQREKQLKAAREYLKRQQNAK